MANLMGREAVYIQFIYFACLGAIGTLIQYALLIAFVQLFTFSAVLASTIGMTAGALVNYILNYRFIFNSNKRHREVMIKFFSVAIIAVFLNMSFMYSFIENLHLHYIFAQIFSTGLVLIWSYLGNRCWTFRT